MGELMTNVYYNQEKFGLEFVTEFERSEPSYSFDTGLVLWHKDKQAFLFAKDAGCSCPSPFEDLNPSLLQPLNKWQVIEEMVAFAKESYEPNYAENQVMNAIESVLRWKRE